MLQFDRWTIFQILAGFIILPKHQLSEAVVGSSYYKWTGKKVQDASLYPGSERTGLRLDYSEAADFSDIADTIAQEGWLSLSLFCVKRGAFILYRRPYYMSDLDENVKLASGEERCFKPIGISSAQPIGPIHQPKRDSITFFSKPNFGSKAHASSDSVDGSFFNGLKSRVKSLIMIGKQKWMITTGRGRKICVRPKFDEDEESPICLLPDFSATMVGLSGIYIMELTKGCPSDMEKGSTIDVTYCSYWGSVPEPYEATTEAVTQSSARSIRGRSRSGGDMCMSSGLGDFFKLYKARLTNSLDKNVILEWPDLGRNKWKLELMDTIFDVAKEAIPDQLISRSYINIIRELYVLQISKVWKNSGSHAQNAEEELKIGLLKEIDYRGLLFQTTECLASVDNLSPIEDETVTEWESIKNPNVEHINKRIWHELRLGQDNNIILEMTWLISNMIGALCHKVFGYSHNYWAVYIHLVNNMYLLPLKGQWKTKYPHLDILLGGDMKMQYKKLAMITSKALELSNSMEPFQRPTNQTNYESRNSGASLMNQKRRDEDLPKNTERIPEMSETTTIKPDESKKPEDTKKAEESKKAEEPKKPEEPKKVEDPKKAEEPKKPEEPKKVEDPKKAEEPKQSTEASSPKKTEDSKISEEPKKSTEAPAPKKTEAPVVSKSTEGSAPSKAPKEPTPKNTEAKAANAPVTPPAKPEKVSKMEEVEEDD